MENLDRITTDPAVNNGQPCIRGYRISVAAIVDLLANGWSEKRILEVYPHLEEEDIRQVRVYAGLDQA